MKSKLISALVIVATFLMAVIRVAAEPEKIVSHWNFGGDITSYADKYWIFVLPVVSVLLFGIFLYFERNPYKMNGVSKIAVTESNTNALVTYIRAIAPIVLLLVLYVTTCSAQYLTVRPLLILVVLLFIIAFYLYTRRKITAKNL